MPNECQNQNFQTDNFKLVSHRKDAKVLKDKKTVPADFINYNFSLRSLRLCGDFYNSQ
jgi:hypothetical protein